MGNTTMAVVGQPNFNVNENVLLFLRPNFRNEDVPFVAADQGKMTLARDARTGRSVLRSAHVDFDRQDTYREIDAILKPIRAALEEADRTLRAKEERSK